MYLGEVNVNQDNLNAFLAVADELQIHGLSGNNEVGSDCNGKKQLRNKANRPSESPCHVQVYAIFHLLCAKTLCFVRKSDVAVGLVNLIWLITNEFLQIIEIEEQNLKQKNFKILLFASFFLMYPAFVLFVTIIQKLELMLESYLLKKNCDFDLIIFQSLKEGNKRSGDNSMDSLEQPAKRSRPLLPSAASPRPLLSPAPRTEPPLARQPISKPSDIKQSSTPVIKLGQFLTRNIFD